MVPSVGSVVGSVTVGDGDSIMVTTVEVETIVVLQRGPVNPDGHVQLLGAVQLPPFRHSSSQIGVQGELPPV